MSDLSPGPGGGDVSWKNECTVECVLKAWWGSGSEAESSGRLSVMCQSLADEGGFIEDSIQAVQVLSQQFAIVLRLIDFRVKNTHGIKHNGQVSSHVYDLKPYKVHVSARTPIQWPSIMSLKKNRNYIILDILSYLVGPKNLTLWNVFFFLLNAYILNIFQETPQNKYFCKHEGGV